MIVNFSDKEVIPCENSIFLAGPTHREKLYASSWRNEAVSILEKLGFDGVVYIPDYEETNLKETEKFGQMEWEWKAMNGAGCILFWIPRKVQEGMPAFTTNVEFGTYLSAKPKQIVYGRPEDAEKMSYLDWLYQKRKGAAPIYNSLEETCKAAMENLK